MNVDSTHTVSSIYNGGEMDEQMHVLRTEQVLKITGLGRTTIWRAVKEGRFPKPLRLGARAVGWAESDIRIWIEGRRAA